MLTPKLSRAMVLRFLLIVLVGYSSAGFARRLQNWNKKETRAALVERLMSALNITKPEDWYGVTSDDITKAGAKGFMRRFSYSPKAMIQSLSGEGLISPPAGGWKDENFGVTRSWRRLETRRELVENLIKLLEIKSPEDWYRVSANNIKAAGGYGYLDLFNGSPREVILKLSSDGLIPRPVGGWRLENFGPTKDWTLVENKKKLVQDLIKLFDIQKVEDWYKVTKVGFKVVGAVGFLRRHGNGPSKAIQALAAENLLPTPEGGWKPEKFGGGINWNLKDSRKALVDALVKNNAIHSPEDWYLISTREFNEANGVGFLGRYSNSPSAAILALSEEGLISPPADGWKEEKFGNATDWSLEISRRQLVAALEESYNLQSPEDWYGLTLKQVTQGGGGGFLVKHNEKLIEMVSALSNEGLISAPTGGWKKKNFEKTIDWKDKNNQRKLVETLKKIRNIESPDDWYRVTPDDFVRAGGTTYRQKHRTVKDTIKALSTEGFIQAPEGGWSDKAFYVGLKGQKLLAAYVENILKRKVEFNDRKSHGVRNPKTGMPLEADISLPDLKIAFEYQGPHHSDDEGFIFRDEIKRKQFPEKGWLLIEVWEDKWDRSQDSILELLEQRSGHHPSAKIGRELLQLIRISKCEAALERLNILPEL